VGLLSVFFPLTGQINVWFLEAGWIFILIWVPLIMVPDTCHSSFAKDLFSASSHSSHVLGSFMKANDFDACMVPLLPLCLK
jgi:hypothetical protein